MSALLPTRARLLIALAAIPLVGALFVPIWRITLEAPQYPEGIGMLIRLGTVTGVKEQDLDNINGLNHYIGMRAIAPDAIPELRVMPYVVGALAVGALLVALVRRRAALAAWLGAFLALGVAGLWDFWKWGYDYGHDLAPDAIIKIPGMVYQPPLIGTKQLLNFTAHSWPDVGAGLLGLAFVLGAVALLLARRAPRRDAVLLGAALTLVGGCAPAGPRALAYGRESCDFCRMTIDDPRYGAEAVTRTGKVHAFDSIECLAAYVAGADGAVRDAWVADVAHPGTLLGVDSARFWRVGGGVTPMGKGLVATAGALAPAPGAQGPMTWAAVRALVAREGMARPEPAHAD